VGMYLEHFKINELPFTLTPNTQFFCELPGHQSAFNVLMVAISNGEGFIKIIGDVGTGKTLLCRKVLNSLDNKFVTAYIANPNLSPLALYRAIAKELSIEIHQNIDQFSILELIYQRLIFLHGNNKHAVLLIDEAQALPQTTLESLRLITNLETESTKLLQVVLFGQQELDVRLKHTSFRQLRQRITFSYRLIPLRRNDIETYLCHRLAMAGYTRGVLFTRRACRTLYQWSRGTPRLINILCHKAMMVAYGRGRTKVTAYEVRQAIRDTESVAQSRIYKIAWVICSMLIGVVLGMVLYGIMG